MQLKQTALLYNSIPAVFWSILNLTPISIYCYTSVNPPLIYWSLGISFAIYLVPNRFINFLQLSQRSIVYRNLGVNVIKRYAQEGDLATHFIKKKYPQYSVIKNRQSLQSYILQTYHFERFHYQLLLIFSIITVYSILQSHFGWALILFLNNIIYNIYPNLLQQYTRIRLRAISSIRDYNRI